MSVVISTEYEIGVIQHDVDDFTEIEFEVRTYDDGTTEVVYAGRAYAHAEAGETADFDYNRLADEVRADWQTGDWDTDPDWGWDD